MSGKSVKTYFMNGVPELLILRELSDRELYGYELTRAIKARTKDAVFLSEGGLYPLLHAARFGAGLWQRIRFLYRLQIDRGYQKYLGKSEL